MNNQVKMCTDERDDDDDDDAARTAIATGGSEETGIFERFQIPPSNPVLARG